MTAERVDIDALERLLAAGTTTPWTTDDAYIVAPVLTGRPNGEVIGNFLPGTGQRHVSYQQQRDNARLAAAVVNALPALIARVRAAEGVRVLAVGLAEIAEARITALEAAARAVETDAATSGEALHVMRMRNGDLQDERDRFRARAAALEAAARAIVADCRVPRGDYLGDMCRWCENTIDRDGHRPGCPVGILVALLGAP